MSKDSADFVSLIFGTLSTVSWSIAQLPQQYTNYENKSCDGISFHFLLLWFLGDLTSLIGGILTNQLKFQIYLATYFLYNDFILLFQWIYYTFIYNTVPPSNDSSSSIYLDIGNDSPNDINNNNNKNDDEDNNNDNDNDPNDDTNDSQNQKLTYIDGIPLTHGDDDIEYYKDSKKYNGKDEDSHDDQDERDEQDEQEPITGSSIGKSAKSSLLKTMLASSISLSSVSNAFPITQILELSSSTASTDQYITTMAEQFKDGSSSPSYKLGRIIAWCCTFIYLSSRIPQLYKNYQRKSVSGINCILFASAVIGNLTYTLSILSSSDFIYNSNKLKFFLNELPYILGSSGTIIFDLIYFYQRSLFGVNSSDIDKDELIHTVNQINNKILMVLIIMKII
ncbi:unnamed protein product [[Candida] boidinii]|nr:unnamed protein product [[Candida] boidinii]